MIPSGTQPSKHDHRDYDLFKTKYGSVGLFSFNDQYNIDKNLWTPDQRIPCTNFIPNVPPLPFGCTDYAQSDVMTDEDGVLYNPLDLENITHANASGGADIRVSLNAVIKLRGDKHPAYFNIKPQPPIDWFDSMRLAMLVAEGESRAVSIGSPWFPEFMNPVDGKAPLPTWDLKRASWHNWCVKGWKTINGEIYLIGKPWLGRSYGDNGFIYFSRSIFNALMSIQGSVAYTLDKLLPGEKPVSVNSTVLQFIISLIRNIWQVK